MSPPLRLKSSLWWIVLGPALAAATLVVGQGIPVTGGAEPADPPVAVFADLDGIWEGSFVGYDSTGQELYRIHARHTYRTVDAERQEVKIVDTMPDGTVITGEGYNIARRGEDGTLTLRCEIEKSNGDRVEHQGTLTRSPDGIPQLVWTTDEPGRLEVFREVVRRDRDGWLYTIDGVGRYGDATVVMTGRYRKLM